MTRHAIDGLVHSLTPHASRRGAMRAVGMLGLASLLDRSDAQAKRKRKKKKKKCPKVRQGFCAGKNICSESGVIPNCNKPDTDPCRCYLRSDAGHVGESICGSLIQTTVTSCAACPAGQMCVLMGGVCAGPGFACVTTCPDPL